MNGPGLLTVRALLEHGRLRDIDVILKRPSVTRLFIGQLPDAVVKTVPYLFTLCAHAQRAAAQAALDAGLGVNAGHDLNRDNLTDFLRAVPGVAEVSIGHALIADALELGYTATVADYLRCIDAAFTPSLAT